MTDIGAGAQRQERPETKQAFVKPFAYAGAVFAALSGAWLLGYHLVSAADTSEALTRIALMVIIPATITGLWADHSRKNWSTARVIWTFASLFVIIAILQATGHDIRLATAAERF